MAALNLLLEKPMQKILKSIFLLGFFFLARQSFAGEYTVAVFHDQDPQNSSCALEGYGCSLRNTILSLPALSPSNPENIIYLKAGHYLVQCASHPVSETVWIGGSIRIDSNIRIVGEGIDKTFIECANDTEDGDRFFNIKSGAGDVRMESLTIGSPTQRNRIGGGIINSGGLALRSVKLINNVSAAGGAIANNGSLDLFQVQAIMNRAVLPEVPDPAVPVIGMGGAILHLAGQLKVSSSAFDHNISVRDGGGIAVVNDGRALAPLNFSLTNVTLGKNRAGFGVSAVAGLGGGLFVKQPLATANLVNVTIANNSAVGYGGGLAVIASSTIGMVNTLIAANESNASPDCSGNIVTQGYNLIRNAEGCQLQSASGATGGQETHDLLGTREAPIADGIPAGLDGVGGRHTDICFAF